jgi:hypothetical protein
MQRGGGRVVLAGNGQLMVTQMSETEERRECIAELRQIAEQAADAEKAAQCRRLAENILGDPAAEALIRLAEEFEAKAAACDRARSRHTRHRAARAKPSNAIQGV